MAGAVIAGIGGSKAAIAPLTETRHIGKRYIMDYDQLKYESNDSSGSQSESMKKKAGTLRQKFPRSVLLDPNLLFIHR
jgi:hypothetical protein